MAFLKLNKEFFDRVSEKFEPPHMLEPGPDQGGVLTLDAFLELNALDDAVNNGLESL